MVKCHHCHREFSQEDLIAHAKDLRAIGIRITRKGAVLTKPMKAMSRDARMASNSRVRTRGGRKKVFTKCGHCRRNFSARIFREHRFALKKRGIIVDETGRVHEAATKARAAAK